MAKTKILYFDIPEWDIDETFEVDNLEEAYTILSDRLADLLKVKVVCLAGISGTEQDFHSLFSMDDLDRLLDATKDRILFLYEENEAFYALVLYGSQFFGIQIGEWSEQENIDEAVEKLREVLS